jgi:leader peptidase (prepilin peptidase) / N-methyltransferase
LSAIICIITGIFVAILLNYLADVLPMTGKFSRPTCHKCGHSFTAKEYLFSFHCPNCGAKPSSRYWIVMVCGIFGSLLLAIFPLKPLGFWISLPMITFLALVMIIDIEYRAVLLGTDIIGFILSVFYGLLLHRPSEMILGGLAGTAIMTLFYFGGFFFNKIFGEIRHQEISEVALGLGDVFVCGYLGLIMGWPHIIAMIIIAVLSAGVFSLGYILVKLIQKRYTAFSAIPYIPFLILAALAMFYLPG